MEEFNLDFQKLKKVLEALFFVTRKPLTLEEIQKITGQSPPVLEAAIGELISKHENEGGLKIIKVAHGYIMGTDPQCAEYVDRLVHSKIEATLSPQALEALAIVAYKQPVTRLELEAIRGVFCDGVLETLLSKRLIEEKGRSPKLGRPILYGTTVEFLRHFGLKDTTDLPPLPQALEEQKGLFKEALHESPNS